MTGTKKKHGSHGNNPPNERPDLKSAPSMNGDIPAQSAQNFAKLAISPELASFRVITNRERSDLMEQLDHQALLDVLCQQTKAVQEGNLREVEAMLINQAMALQSLFVKLTETGLQSSMLPQQETALRLALKAQNQCRATLETLASIKSPPIVYAQQANIANGPQQVNNGTAAPPPSSSARETQPLPNKLLEKQDGERLDARTTGTASRVDPAMATMETIHRPQKRCR